MNKLHHPRLGTLEIHVRSDSRYVRARWSGGVVKITAPDSLSMSELRRIVDEMEPRISASRRDVSYSCGDQLLFDGWRADIGSQSYQPDRIIVRHVFPQANLLVGTNVGFDSPFATKYISDALKSVAARFAPDLLIPQARETAARLGLSPSSWKIKNTTRQLGSCNRRGEISLSSQLMFLSDELRHYIICHELAHLTEMNHSRRFHALLDRYVDGRKKFLEARLKSFPWPILR